MTFVELRAHSAFSFGDGAMSPESLVHRAAELGYSAVGLTDAADLGGIPRFITEAGRKNLKPIVGAELEVDGCPLALLVRSREGYRNLAALVTRARVADLDTWHPDRPHVPRGRPGVSWTDVAERSGGLHLLTGPGSSRLAALMRANNLYDAEQHLARGRDVFGEHVAIEVQRHQAGRHEAALADALIELAGRERVPWVVTQNPRYLDDRGRLVHDMLTALRANLTLDEAAHAGVLLPNGRWRLLAPGEMARLWARQPAGLEESERIAAGCSFDVEWMRPALPDFSPPRDEQGRAYTGSLDDFLREQVYAGAHVRWGHDLSSEQCRQIEHELGVISRLRFAGFFLVIWDAVRHARSLGILCQGRGSAANSAVAYCLDVTAVDPIANGLLFERFLSEGRLDGNTEAPDIDVDIEHDRREEVLDYVYAKWHRSQAAITCTVQHYRAPNALLDAMRALGFPVDLAHSVSKRMHHAEPADGAELLKQGLAAQFGLALDDARGRTLVALMQGCEGLPRMRSTHVGGFVLSAEPLGNCLPIEPTAMGRTIVQFDKDDLDQLGIPKFDFLGLGALAMVRRAFDAIERRTGTRPELYRLPYEDAPTYELVARGDTVGTFQIESRAQIASLVHTRPELLYDIVVQVALIRPGPIQAGFVHPYTRRRRGQEEPDYIDESLRPILEPILKRTYGIPIFQEQAMAIAMQLGRYSAAEADGLRRTMGHQRKRKRLMAELAKLEAAITAQGIAAPIAAKVVQYLESFGSYGFPESHAWSFALIAYATAWLKQHYAPEFYMGLLNAWPMGFYSPATLMHDAKRQGVAVRPPCLHRGDWESTVEWEGEPKPALRIGWRHVRGIGARVLDQLRAARATGVFDGIESVVRRAGLGRGEALALAQAGAFAAWEPDRRRAAWEALRAVGDLLPLAPASHAVHDPRALERPELVALDYAATGISLNGHPMEEVRERLRAAGALDSAQLMRCRNGRQVLVAGLVTIRQRPQTANGTIFLLLEDEHGFINVIVPERLVEANIEVVKYAPYVLVTGRLERAGSVLNVAGRVFSELETRPLVHSSRDFR